MIGTILSASEGHYIIVAVFEQFSISKFVQVTSTAPSYQTFLFLRQMVKISYIIGQIKKIFWTKFISDFQFYIINCCKQTLVVRNIHFIFELSSLTIFNAWWSAISNNILLWKDHCPDHQYQICILEIVNFTTKIDAHQLIMKPLIGSFHLTF